MDLKSIVEKSGAIDTLIMPETKTTEQAKNTAAKADAFQSSEVQRDALDEEKRSALRAVFQRSENRTVPAKKIIKAKIDEQENPAEAVEMALEGGEEAAPARPSPKKSPKKKEAIKSEDARKSSEAEKNEVNLKSDDSAAPIEKDHTKKAANRMISEDSDQPEGDNATTFDKGIYVGHLNFNTSKDTVTKHFSQFGEVVGVNLPLNRSSTNNKGYAFVTFKEASSATKALADTLQEIDSFRILLEQQKDILPWSSHPHLLFVGGLNSCTQSHTLEQYFSKYGKVNNVSVPWNNRVDQNKGIAFVSFVSSASLISALEEEHEIDGKKIGIRDATAAGRKKSEDFGQPGGGHITNFENQLYVKHLSVRTLEKTVKEHFSQFGEVFGVYLPRKRRSSEENYGYAIVTFTEASSAKKALADNEQEIDTEKIVLRPRKIPIPKPSHPNQLFVGRLDHSTQKRTLKEYFAKYGKVTKVSLPWNKRVCENKGYAFVSFESAASLQSALAEDHEVDGRKIGVRAGKAAVKEENPADAATKKEEVEGDDDDEEKEAREEAESIDSEEDEDEEGENDAEAKGDAGGEKFAGEEVDSAKHDVVEGDDKGEKDN